MKKINLTLLLFLTAFVLHAQKDYKVVFDLTSKDSAAQQSAIRWVTGIIKSDPGANLEIVMYSKGVNLVVKDKSFFTDAVIDLAKNKNVSFKVCAVALKSQNIDPSQVLPGVEIVPDGIYEIFTKQREGWGYIKIAN